jgi:polyhydroxyalkanoate synthase
LRSGSLPWKAELRAEAEALQERLASVDPDAFESAVAAELQRRALALAEGILGYRRHPYRRDLAEPPALWRRGSARLLDYGAAPEADPAAAAGAPVLFVPSLVNRAYILDLSARRSLLRWLAGRGLRPLLLDWGRPDAEERGFSLTAYILHRLEPALDAALAACGRKPVLVGYCMGGNLALAPALRRPHDLAGLVLMATPWDFHAGPGCPARLAQVSLAALAPVLQTLGELPVDALQALFAALDPQLVPRKFVAFAGLAADSPSAEAFVALEDWLNDGVPLAAPVARECLGAWYGENTPRRGLWRIDGRPMRPDELAVPNLHLIPEQDRIVPPDSARALAEACPDAEIARPHAGHIGMVASAGAPERVWTPLAAWLAARLA